MVINSYGHVILIQIRHGRQSSQDENQMLEKEACSMVYLNCQDMRSDSPKWMMPLAGSRLKTEGDHLYIKIVASVLICNANTLLSYLENVWFDNQ